MGIHLACAEAVLWQGQSQNHLQPQYFVTRLSSDDESEDETVRTDDVRKALERLVDVAETNKIFDISKSFVDETDAASESESVESV